MAPSVVGTIAIFEVIEPSVALSVETPGCVAPEGHRDKYPSTPEGTTVAFNT